MTTPLTTPSFRRPSPHPALVAGVSHGQAATADRSLDFDTRLLLGPASAKAENVAPHTLFSGATGSGKTTLVKKLMMSVFPDPTGRFPLRYRGVVYDPKPEFYTALRGMGVPEDAIIVTNPYDARSSAWRVATDVATSDGAEALAEAIVPTRGDDAPKGVDGFWSEAAHLTVKAVTLALQQDLPGQWDLLDLAMGSLREELRAALLDRTELGKLVQTRLLQKEARHTAGIDAQLMTHVGWLLELGALWREATYSFSFKGWSRSTGVVLVSRHADAPEAVDRVNRMLMRMAFRATLALPEGLDRTHDQTWFFLDELTQAGRFSGFANWLRMSRSKGVRAVLAFQDSSGLATAFGEKESKSVINQCGNRAACAMNDFAEARFASELFAQHETPRVSRTVTDDGKSSTSTHLETRPVVSPETIQQLRLVRELRGGVEGYFFTGAAGTFYGAVSAEQRRRLLGRVDDAPAHLWPAFEPRMASRSGTVWTPADTRRLVVAEADRPSSANPSFRRPTQVLPFDL